MTDSHHLFEEWLIEGAIGDPPRELAVHATVCESCARRLGAFDSLAEVDVGSAGSPPPIVAPSRVVIGLAWARRGTAVLGTMVAAVIIFFSASQLIGFVGDLGPGPSDGVALTSSSEPGQDEPRTVGPEPAAEPSINEPTPTPIPTFIPLPSVAPQAAPLAPPGGPLLFKGSVSQTTVNMTWSDPVGGGPVQKWEIWRRTGSGSWIKIGELFPFAHALTDGGRSPGTTYSYRIRGVNASWLGTFSNVITATTLSPPPTPSPSQSTPECNDSLDNDGDTFIDYPNDPGCSSAADTSEAPFNAECNDGSDNDGDTFIDYPNDPGCASAADDEAPFNAECNDGSDNDGDSFIDYPNDPGCASAADDEAPYNAECNDGSDNDGDGLVDFVGGDPGCTDEFDPDESPVNTQCTDGIDNDGDTYVDLADPSCTSIFVNDESPSDP